MASDNPNKLGPDLPGTWQSMGLGLGVYVNTEKTEAVYLSGFLRTPTKADIEGAIRFLRNLQAYAPD